MVQNRERRRQLVVDSPIQSRIVMAISWPIVACLAVTAALLAWFGDLLATEAADSGVALPALTPLLFTVIGFMVASAAYMVWHFLKVSNRVVGPIYRIEKTLADVRGGDRSARVRLRDGDFLGTTAEHVNQLLDWVEATLSDTSTCGPQGASTSADDVTSNEPQVPVEAE